MATADWTSLPEDHNLAIFASDLPTLLETAGYNEMYGVHLAAASEGYAAEHSEGEEHV